MGGALRKERQEEHCAGSPRHTCSRNMHSVPSAALAKKNKERGVLIRDIALTERGMNGK